MKSYLMAILITISACSSLPMREDPLLVVVARYPLRSEELYSIAKNFCKNIEPNLVSVLCKIETKKCRVLYNCKNKGESHGNMFGM